MVIQATIKCELRPRSGASEYGDPNGAVVSCQWSNWLPKTGSYESIGYMLAAAVEKAEQYYKWMIQVVYDPDQWPVVCTGVSLGLWISVSQRAREMSLPISLAS